eukprot:c13580_g1_i1.p1 GENE.c13580_g1_i1~~c13580_g1_i1.p1  ORF type:complete len:540 (-),score=72.25 c13580_g1_i1:174-1793(-)
MTRGDLSCLGPGSKKNAKSVAECGARGFIRITDRTARHPSMLGFEYHETDVRCCKRSRSSTIGVPVFATEYSGDIPPFTGFVNISRISTNSWDDQVFHRAEFLGFFRIFLPIVNLVGAVLAIRTFVVQRIHAQHFHSASASWLMPPQQVASLLESVASTVRLVYLCIGPVFSSGILPFPIHVVCISLILPMQTLVVVAVACLFRAITNFTCRTRIVTALPTILSGLVFVVAVVPAAVFLARAIPWTDALSFVLASQLLTSIVAVVFYAPTARTFVRRVGKSMQLCRSAEAAKAARSSIDRFLRWTGFALAIHLTQWATLLFALCKPSQFLTPCGFSVVFGLLYATTSFSSLYNVVALQPYNKSLPRFSLRSLSSNFSNFRRQGRSRAQTRSLSTGAVRRQSLPQSTIVDEPIPTNRSGMIRYTTNPPGVAQPRRNGVQERLALTRSRSSSNDQFPDNYLSNLNLFPEGEVVEEVNRKRRLRGRSVSGLGTGIKSMRRTSMLRSRIAASGRSLRNLSKRSSVTSQSEITNPVRSATKEEL